MKDADRPKAEDEHGIPRAGACAILPVEYSIERLRYRGEHEGKVVRDTDDTSGSHRVAWDGHHLGHAARQIGAEQFAMQAEVAFADPTEPAFQTRNTRVDGDLGADRVADRVGCDYRPSNFMAEDLPALELRAPVVTSPDVGTTHSGGSRGQQKPALRQFRGRNLLDTDITGCVKDDGEHACFSSLRDRVLNPGWSASAPRRRRRPAIGPSTSRGCAQRPLGGPRGW